MEQCADPSTHLGNLLSKHTFDISFYFDRSLYEPIENIGVGAYGVVCSAFCKKSGKRVAIKKIPNAFDMLTTAKRTFRELKILNHFKHENIVSIIDIINPTQPISNFKDVYVVFDLMESDLHHIIQSPQVLTIEHTQFFIYQILRGLKYIHSANVIHRDLKPSNILVNENAELKIGDFGMARGLSPDIGDRITMVTEYVATRWYRPPELLLGYADSSTRLDIWSTGCIFAELLGRRPLFPGKNYIEQINLIKNVLGNLPECLLTNIRSERVQKFISCLPRNEAVLLQSIYPGVPSPALELLRSMLCYSPTERLTSESALRHPFIQPYHDVEYEPNCYPPFDFDFEHESFTKEELKSKIIREINAFQERKLKKERAISIAEQLINPVRNDQLESESEVDETPEIQDKKESIGGGGGGCSMDVGERTNDKSERKAVLRAAILRMVKEGRTTSNAESNESVREKVTAAGRRRERVGKRKERVAKAKRKNKTVKSGKELLSVADRSMLERWMGMHSGRPGRSDEGSTRKKLGTFHSRPRSERGLPARTVLLGYSVLQPNRQYIAAQGADSPGYVGTKVSTPGYVGTKVKSPGCVGTKVTTPGYLGTKDTTPGYVRTKDTTPGYVGTKVTTPGYVATAVTTPGYVGTSAQFPTDSRNSLHSQQPPTEVTSDYINELPGDGSLVTNPIDLISNNTHLETNQSESNFDNIHLGANLRKPTSSSTNNLSLLETNRDESLYDPLSNSPRSDFPFRLLTKDSLLPQPLSSTPKGDGSGYSLGFNIDELFDTLGSPPCGSDVVPGGPASAGLISDWGELLNLQPGDMAILERELAMGFPDLMSATDETINSDST